MSSKGKPGHVNGKYFGRSFWSRKEPAGGSFAGAPLLPVLLTPFYWQFYWLTEASLALLWVVPLLKITCHCVAFIITPSEYRSSTVNVQQLQALLVDLDSVLASRTVWLYLCTSWGEKRGKWRFLCLHPLILLHLSPSSTFLDVNCILWWVTRVTCSVFKSMLATIKICKKTLTEHWSKLIISSFSHRRSQQPPLCTPCACAGQWDVGCSFTAQSESL